MKTLSYLPPRLVTYGTIEDLTRQANGKWSGGSDGRSGIDNALANSKCPGGVDGSQSTHNDSENPLYCS